VGWYPYLFVDLHRHGGYLLVIGDTLAIGVGLLALGVATGDGRSQAQAANTPLG
jgi:hypothetical protein